MACSSSPSSAPSTATPGLMFHFPAAGQLDVPLGTRVTVSFSTDIDPNALGSCSGICIEGPDGPVESVATIGDDGKSISIENAKLDPGVTYQVLVGQALSPDAGNLPSGDALFEFTTRNARPRAAAPTLVAVNGTAQGAEARPILFETSTIRLLFSEPLDSATVEIAPGSIELVDGTGTPILAKVIASGLHVSIDPAIDLIGGQAVEVRIGRLIRDLGGQAMTPTSISLTPGVSRTGPPVVQTLRTRLEGDPGPKRTRSGAATNVIVMDKPLIGRETLALTESAIAAELGDPQVLGGPIAFTIRAGQRLNTEALVVKLGGEIPAGLETGDIQIEFLTDADGRLYRNPFQDPAQPPDESAPLYVDLRFDVAITASDPRGNAVISQTILGVQASGTAVATDGVLAIETVAVMELGLLGITEAPTNLVLELITDRLVEVAPDTRPPIVVATYPADGSSDFSVGNAIEVTFDEPIDIDSARDGGLRLETAAGEPIAAGVELQGSVLVLRPLDRLSYQTAYNLVFADLRDVAGNALPGGTMTFTTPLFEQTDVPMTLVAINPGVPCALTDGDAASPGRCASGDGADDRYAPFALAADEHIEAVFTQPIDPTSITLAASCNDENASIRIERLDSAGTCTDVVAGTFLPRERSFVFISDTPWDVDERYRLSLISGGNDRCDEGELCALSGGEAASFDPLDGHEDNDAGGEDLIIDFVGGPALEDTFLFSDANPSTDVNGSGFSDGGEELRDNNRAAMRIKGVTGDVDEASFDMDDCLPETPEVDGCMYLLGSLPVAMGELERDCSLPSGETVSACIPVSVRPQVMYATSMAMDADAGVNISTETGLNIMRIRERPGGIRGFIIDDGGSPVMVVDLELYMDAPDMSITLSSHDLHSKPLTMSLRGPVSFLPDGRIVINLANVTPIEVEVAVDGSFGIDGSIILEVPTSQMKLQLLSRPSRGLER